MSQVTSVRLDEKGRVTIPRGVREDLHLKPGDVLFITSDASTATLHLGKAINPFDVLAEHALAEYRAGRTTSLDDFAREEGITLDRE